MVSGMATTKKKTRRAADTTKAGWALLKARTVLGLTQEQLAVALGYEGHRRVRAWEAGESEPPYPVLALVELWAYDKYPIGVNARLQKHLAARGHYAPSVLVR